MPTSQIQIEVSQYAAANGIPSPLNLLMGAQAAYETGDFTSDIFKNTDNAFNYKYTTSSTLQIGYFSAAGSQWGKYQQINDSVQEVVKWIHRRQNDGTFPQDLSTINTPALYAYYLQQGGFYGTDSYYNYANGIATYYDNSKPFSTGSIPPNSDAAIGNNPNLNIGNLNNDFKQIQQNIQNLEANNNAKGVIWGQRNSMLESFDWIGLKQYLLYLCTTYYPMNLVPFVELIPKFFTDSPYSSPNDNNNSTNNDTTVATSQNIQNDTFSAPIGLDRRFRKNALRQNTLTNNGQIDLLTMDPFKEVTDSLNYLNADGEKFFKERGFGYRIFGMIELSPSIVGDETSKAGTVGFTSIEIEGGSQVNNNMSLITIEMLDLQGNKFLDINSPWSFLLNSRPQEVTSDFYFRYGWQVRIPELSPQDAIKSDDSEAKKFWSHPGWGLFDNQEGSDIKKYIYSISKVSQNTITLTQSSNPSSFQTPGYMLEQKTGIFTVNQQTRNLGFEDYLTLTLRNPEIKINPKDGSITGVLYFMNVSTVANCLCPLADAKNMQSLVQSAANGKTNLLTLMTYFFADNNDYFNNPKIQKKYDIDNHDLINVKKNKQVDKNNNTVTNLDPLSVSSYITVIGSVPRTDNKDAPAQQNDYYPLLDPASIPIYIGNDKASIINNAITSSDPQTTLIWWLNSVLQDNFVTPLSAVGQVTSGADLTNNFILSYEYDKAKAKNPDLATGVTTVSNVVKNDYKSRLSIQDDVFSFRFRGSLVEELSIEKLDTPSQFQIQIEKELSNTILKNQNDMQNKNVSNMQTSNEKYFNSSQAYKLFPGDQKVAELTAETNTLINGQQQNVQDAQNIVYYVANDAVTYVNKREYLAMIYSQMMGLNIRCLAHPWIKIGLPIGVKGTGFFDGPYLVTKIKHSLTTDNRFTSEISACRIINQNEFQKQQDNAISLRSIAQNNPEIGITSAAKLQPIKYIDHLYVRPSYIPSVSPFASSNFSINTNKSNFSNSSNQQLSKNIKFYANMEYQNSISNTSDSIQIEKYQSLTGNLTSQNLQNNWNFDFIEWIANKAQGLFDIYTNSNPNNSSFFPSTAKTNQDIYNAFIYNNSVISDITNLVYNSANYSTSNSASVDNTTNLINYSNTSINFSNYISPDDLVFLFFNDGGRLKDGTIHESNIFIGVVTKWIATPSANSNSSKGILRTVFGDFINISEQNTDNQTAGVFKQLDLQIYSTSSITFKETGFGSFLGFGII